MASLARFTSVAPIFPVRDLARTLAHYTALGFTTHPYQDGSEYGYANRDGLGLHFSVHPDMDPTSHASAAYLYVDDADALYEEWSRADVGGRLVRPTDAPYGLREGAHLDLDNNLIRFGSPLS
jgi:hypothetical protein